MLRSCGRTFDADVVVVVGSVKRITPFFFVFGRGCWCYTCHKETPSFCYVGVGVVKKRTRVLSYFLFVCRLQQVATAAEEYGYHMGLAFQIVDDILDIVGAADVLGKPAMADMSLGLATAPILYAAENAPEIKKIVKRRFKKEGDKEKALKAVLAGDAVARSRELARWHAQRAVDAVLRLPPSEARNGLVNICHIVLTRNK
ncbi:unnamed protein product [Ectocarpus sp. 12 AP-2014]